MYIKNSFFKILKPYDILFVLSMCFCVIFYINYYGLNIDSTWILHCSQEMIKGQILYIDKIDVNPPLIFIYSLFPAFLSLVLPIKVEILYTLFILVLSFFSIYISSIILKQVFFKNLRLIFYSLFFILSISLSFNFGEREHLLMIFILPYIFQQIFWDQLQNKHVILISFFASLGFNLKPHFILIFVCIIIFNLIKSKKSSTLYRQDFLIIFSSMIFYLLIILIFFSDYINEIIPLSFNTYTQRVSILSLFMQIEILLFIFSLLFYIFLKNKKYFENIKLLFLLICTSFIIYLLQGKGWSYHLIPFYILTQILLLFIFVKTFKENRIYFFLFLPVFMYVLFFNNIYNLVYPDLKDFIKKQEENKKIYIFSIDIGEGHNLLKPSQTWSSRYPSLFMLPQIIIKKDIKIKQKLFNHIYEDFIKYKPDLIIFPNKGLNYYKFFTDSKYKINDFLSNNYKKSTFNNYLILKKTSNKDKEEYKFKKEKI